MIVVNARNLGTTLNAETSLEGPVALGFVYPDEPDEVAVRMDVASVDDLPTAVLLMVRDLGALGGGPTSVIEGERLLARLGIVSGRRDSVGAP